MIQKSCSYEDLRYLHPHQQPWQVQIRLFLHRKRIHFLLSPKPPHTQAFSLLSLNEDTHSHARGFLAGTTPVLLTWKVFSFLCVIDRFNREHPIVCGGKSPPELVYLIFLPYWATTDWLTHRNAFILYPYHSCISTFLFQLCHFNVNR